MKNKFYAQVLIYFLFLFAHRYAQWQLSDTYLNTRLPKNIYFTSEKKDWFKLANFIELHSPVMISLVIVKVEI